MILFICGKYSLLVHRVGDCHIDVGKAHGIKVVDFLIRSPALFIPQNEFNQNRVNVVIGEFTVFMATKCIFGCSNNTRGVWFSFPTPHSEFRLVTQTL